MMNYKKQLFRIIDANINRAKEGIRVCEDIMRFAINDKYNSLKLKRLRHRVSEALKHSRINKFEILANRDGKHDIGKYLTSLNPKRNILEVFLANSQRTKEAMRVLEELFSIFDKDISRKFLNLRFNIYDIEKECTKKIKDLCNI